MNSRWFLYVAAGGLLAAVVEAQIPSGYSPDDFQRRIVDMGGTYYSDAEWRAFLDDMEAARSRADADGDAAGAVDIGLCQARAYSELRGDYVRAMALLEKLKVEYGNEPLDNIRDVFLMQAKIYARQGNPQGVNRLILEFRDNRNYDGAGFVYEGGQNRETPLVITRPHARGSDSITITALEKYKRQAESGTGQAMPEITVGDQRGNKYRLTSLPWKVTLVDMWYSSWVTWQRDLPYLLAAQSDYAGVGFGVLGIALDRDPAPGLAWLKEQGARWPQVVAPDPRLARFFGLYGEPANFLVDQQGRILARNVRGTELVSLVRQALGID